MKKVINLFKKPLLKGDKLICPKCYAENFGLFVERGNKILTIECSYCGGKASFKIKKTTKRWEP